MGTRPIQDLLGIWWDWEKRGGLPLQENETAVLGGGKGKLADLNRIGIEGKSRHCFKAQPLNKILPRQKLDFGAGGKA